VLSKGALGEAGCTAGQLEDRDAVTAQRLVGQHAADATALGENAIEADRPRKNRAAGDDLVYGLLTKQSLSVAGQQPPTEVGLHNEPSGTDVPGQQTDFADTVPGQRAHRSQASPVSS